MSNPVRVAAIQMCSGVVAQTNIDFIAQQVAKAVAAGAHYVLTPEVSIVFARDNEQLRHAVTHQAGEMAIAACADIARRHQIFLHIGSLAIVHESGRFLNRSVLLTPGGEVSTIYDKIHLFDADPPDDQPYRESDTYIAGDHAVLTSAPGFLLGMSICYDVRFPKLFNRLASAGVTVFSVPAAFTVPTGQAHWEVLLRARAIETGSYVVAAAQGGHHENGRVTYGHSMIIDPWGTVLARLNDDRPGFIVADIELEKTIDARARIPALANVRPFSLSVNHNAL